MVALLTLAALVLAVLVANLFARLKLVERQLAALRESGLAAAPVEMPPVATQPQRAERVPARVVRAAPDAPPEPAAPDPPPPPEPPPPPAEPEPAPAQPFGGFENLVGSRLPIWIGGAALILAGFFLVRYSIESGLLGPVARSVLGALFGLALLAGSEAARRLPATIDDPRIGQALAGAGIAILYGTLYMAAELHGLIGGLAAFVLMIAITVAALALSLRHGPPTAIMGLVGGFAAPLVTGIDAAGVAPLLIYLALFTAGLFALAVHRGWMWLALAATAGALAWPLVLIGLVAADQLPLVGLFVLTLAFAGTLALPAAGAGNRWFRLAPLAVGLLQLVLIAPRMDFSPLAWGLYGLLAAAALWLGWRDTRLAAGAAAALGLALVLLVAGLGFGDDERSALWAAAAFALMFGGAGHALARRAEDGRIWTAIALGSTAGPLLLAYMLAIGLPGPWPRALIAALAAAAAAHLSWRFRDEASLEPRWSLGLAGGGAVAALLAAVAIGQVAESHWIAAGIALAGLGLAGWAGHAGDRWSARIALVGFGAVALVPGVIAILPAIGAALGGEPLTYPLLPPLADALREAGLPGLLLLGALWAARGAAGGGAVWRTGVTLGVTGLLIALHVLARQPLAIATAGAFVQYGMAERAAITQALLAAGAALLLIARPAFRPLGIALLALGLFRFVWFDLMLFSPLFVAQRVGGVPLLNLALLHPALVGLWLHLSAPRLGDPRHARAARAGAMIAVAIAACGAVRQLSHGTLIAAPSVSRGENYLYSAVLLVLSIVWLWRGIATGSRPLRLSALALLTAVTLKVFLIDAAALEGVLRILSFLGLGVALIAIGWAYNRFLGAKAAPASG